MAYAKKPKKPRIAASGFLTNCWYGLNYFRKLHIGTGFAELLVLADYSVIENHGFGVTSNRAPPLVIDNASRGLIHDRMHDQKRSIVNCPYFAGGR